jgi:hypothetical protein
MRCAKDLADDTASPGIIRLRQADQSTLARAFFAAIKRKKISQDHRLMRLTAQRGRRYHRQFAAFLSDGWGLFYRVFHAV